MYKKIIKQNLDIFWVLQHTWFENTLSMSVTSPKAARDIHHWELMKCKFHMRFGVCTFKTVIMATIKYDIQSVLKTVAPVAINQP
jgi:hypothetical protein